MQVETKEEEATRDKLVEAALALDPHLFDRPEDVDPSVPSLSE